MILYLDTSALVKLYASEEGSPSVKAAVAEADVVATATIAFVETRSAFARKHRLGEWTDRELSRSRHAFEADWHRLDRIEVTEPLVHRAADLAEAHALRAYDSLHLAAADRLAIVAGEVVTFACFDHALEEAASRVGLDRLPSS